MQDPSQHDEVIIGDAIVYKVLFSGALTRVGRCSKPFFLQPDRRWSPGSKGLTVQAEQEQAGSAARVARGSRSVWLAARRG